MGCGFLEVVRCALKVCCVHVHVLKKKKERNKNLALAHHIYPFLHAAENLRPSVLHFCFCRRSLLSSLSSFCCFSAPIVSTSSTVR